MIRNILFDLDETLFDFKKAEQQALSKALTEVGVDLTEKILERYSEINLSQWKLLENQVITREQVKLHRFELLFEEFSVSADAAKTAERYENLLGIGHYFMDGAQELLQQAYGKYRMYLVSNGTLSVQTGRLESAKIAPLFDGIFISEEVGADKPSKVFFDHVFAHITDFHKEETVIVGDSLTSDIRGGNMAGITTIWSNLRGQNNPGDIHPDYEIHALKELLPLIETL